MLIKKNYVVCRFLKLQEYNFILRLMQNFTKGRDHNIIDEIWFLEHYPVFTVGQAGLDLHILDAKEIPVVSSDRGGQVTYHGPGQLIIYFLIDLARKDLNLRQLIKIILESVVELLRVEYNLSAYIHKDLPGVYINEAKICSLGLKINKSCSYHGLSLNINMNLEPFKQINPCGVKNLKMVQLKDFCKNPSDLLDIMPVAIKLKNLFLAKLSYDELSLTVLPIELDLTRRLLNVN